MERFNQKNLPEYKKLEYTDSKEETEKALEKIEGFRKFLDQQISLPPEKWNEKFKEYVEEKYQESQEEIPERTIEEEKNITFERYLKNLDISKEDLKDKRILDLGCGDGEFVKECLDRNISKEIYGLDSQINPEDFEEKYRKYFLKGDFQKELPMKNLDLIISLAAVEAPFDKLNINSPKTTIDLALKALKENGEIRIFPLRKTHLRSNLKGVEFSEKKWKEILKKLAAEKNIEYKICPIDIKAAGKNKDVWLEQVLIIKKSKT